jgi:hypothetical protein
VYRPYSPLYFLALFEEAGAREVVPTICCPIKELLLLRCTHMHTQCSAHRRDTHKKVDTQSASSDGSP